MATLARGWRGLHAVKPGRSAQLNLTKMIEQQLTQGTAHFREQAEAWLAEVMGEEVAALMVDRPRG